MNDLLIRRAGAEDYPFILRTNAENVEVLSPMDEERLAYFDRTAEVFLVAQIGNTPAAFLIALREDADAYDSENYLWFRKHYEQFLYIDRIVIDEPYRGMGIGKQLYQAVFRHAAATGVPYVTAEIDTEPYNEASLQFHKAMGFKEVGVQTIRGGAVTVSLQEARP